MTDQKSIISDLDDDTLAEAVDTGTKTSKAEPIRRCLATGARLEKASLIRFVLAPDGSVTPDLSETLPGRGMWLSANAGSIKTAVARQLFAKAARTKVYAAPDLDARVEDLLAQRCVETLSLARRAGEAVSGFEKARAAVISGLANGPVRLLLQATDGADDGRAKITALVRAVPDSDDLAIVSVLSADELGRAFGRERTVHVAVRFGGLCQRLAIETARLAGFRADTAG